MKFRDIIALSINNLTHRGLRSWLTILGIVVGVGAVVSIISMGSGLQRNISNQLGGLGADIIDISSGSSRAIGFGFGGRENEGRTQTVSKNLTTTDVLVIKNVLGVKFVDGIVSGRISVTYLSQTSALSVEGVDPLAWSGITTAQLESGRFLSPGDGNVVVIGNGIANNVFKQILTTGTLINIGGSSFKIVGILKQSGSTTRFGGYDNTIFMPASSARTVVNEVTANQFSSIEVKVEDSNAATDVANAITNALMLSRHVTNSTKDFSVTSAQAIQQTISSTMGTINIFLEGIAAISLLVGAIGIANTMFTSVIERTRQIGTLKALGATSFEIMKLFVFESAMIGFVGGLIGIFLGFIGSGVISDIGIRIGGGGGGGSTMTVITPQLIFFAIGFSTLIGMLSGLFPARRAASLQPVEALRYE